ncbi:MAG: electron transfer flavoprotein subunit alpha/FixB family protein [Nitrososphaerota archaeon]
MTILVHAENTLLASRLAAAAAKQFLGSSINILHVGEPDQQSLDLYGRAGVSTVYTVSEEAAAGGPAVMAEALGKAVAETASTIVLLSSTKYGREVGPRVAQLVGGSYATECTHMEIVGDGILVKKLVLGGAYQATLLLKMRPYVVGLQATSGPDEKNGQPPRVSRLEADFTGPRIGLLEVSKRAEGHVELERADFIVGVGRGFKKKEDLAMAEELARILGAEVGCSRPISGDLKWMSEDRHIGLSGKRVRPKTYLALGISGQVQHLVGIRDSKLILAINTDPNAPIMSESDYAVVADIYKILPPLIQELKERLGRR